ncbi:DNA-binding CsgD family transcriptional regulator [Povalibacter uvarum]|uniref:DNA-binding CsgD family transcriptional regulator n=1 Tax=Povalibacter uvarum TaxID=732238 RepID=A0A841HPD8_9GAMM|nr:DNA-binding CsgD family transcriptional regulator [Povalibacter uvarum]
MEPFDLAQSFIENSRKDLPATALGEAFRVTLENLGFPYFACCSHVDPCSPPSDAVMLYNYPVSWVTAYSERRLHEIDPVMVHAERTLVPFCWDAPDFRSPLSTPQSDMLAEARSVGLSRGYTIPMRRRRTATCGASCSVISDSSAISAYNYFAAQLVCTFLYERLLDDLLLAHDPRPAISLTPRECQCLELVAEGKSDWAIGQILRISEHTAHRHVENAKRRLGVTTRSHAVVRASQLREISVGDVSRADSVSDFG